MPAVSAPQLEPFPCGTVPALVYPDWLSMFKVNTPISNAPPFVGSSERNGWTWVGVDPQEPSVKTPLFGYLVNIDWAFLLFYTVLPLM